MGRNANCHKNPFFKLTIEEMEFIKKEKDNITEEELDKIIEALLKCIKGYWKYKFYQKLYYMNNILTKTKEPFIITKKPDLKKNKDNKYVISFD